MGYSDDTNMAFSALKYTHTSIFELFIQCVCVYGVNEINMTYIYSKVHWCSQRLLKEISCIIFY